MFTFAVIAVKAHVLIRGNLQKTMKGRKSTHNNVPQTEPVTFLLGTVAN